jgi:hypothetical protein
MNAVVPFGASPVSSSSLRFDPAESAIARKSDLRSQKEIESVDQAWILIQGRTGTFLLCDRRFLVFLDGESQADGIKSHVRQCCPLVLLRVVAACRLCLANRAEVLA